MTVQLGIDFQPYLRAILADEDYREWQDLYTPTTVEDRRRTLAPDTAAISPRRFSSRLKLRAETVKPDKQEQGDRPYGAQDRRRRLSNGMCWRGYGSMLLSMWC